MSVSHQNNFATNLTSNTSAGATTSPINSIPTVDAPYYLAFDATNLNAHYEVVYVTSDTATNVNHAATTYDHTTAEEVRMVLPAVEIDTFNYDWKPITATLTYSSVDAPTYIVTTGGVNLTNDIGVGSKIKLTHAAQAKYFIVTAIDATTITLYGGTDYTLAATAITLPRHSAANSPHDFPMSPVKWTVEVKDVEVRAQATPVANTWYNLNASHTISLPIGCWKVEYNCAFGATDADSLTFENEVTLSTANNSESDVDFTSYVRATSTSIYGTGYRNKIISVAAKTPYYLNTRTETATVDNIYIKGNSAPTIIRAVCAYL